MSERLFFQHYFKLKPESKLGYQNKKRVGSLKTNRKPTICETRRDMESRSKKRQRSIPKAYPAKTGQEETKPRERKRFQLGSFLYVPRIPKTGKRPRSGTK